MSDENELADLLELVLAGRPERVMDVAVGQLRPEQRAAVAAVTEAIAALAVAEPPFAPSPQLRERILCTVRERAARRPRRALVVCDMIGDHLTPGMPLEVPRARAIVPALATRIRESREGGVPVVFLLDRHLPGDAEFDEWGWHAVEGTEGAEVWPALAPLDGDHIVTKPSYSGFHGTTLEHVLDELRVDTLVLTGCATEVQLLATATDALQRGFAVELPRDSQAGASEMTETFALGVLATLVAYVPARIERRQRIERA